MGESTAHLRSAWAGINLLLSNSKLALVLMSLRPKDGPPKARSEGQRPLILREVVRLPDSRRNVRLNDQSRKRLHPCPNPPCVNLLRCGFSR
jgi:hypothetical protein